MSKLSKLLYKKCEDEKGNGFVFQPLPPNQNTVIDFKDETSGPNLPKVYVPAVKKGFQFMCQKGEFNSYSVALVVFHFYSNKYY